MRLRTLGIRNIEGHTDCHSPAWLGHDWRVQTGKLVAVTNQEIVLEDAAWIADTGRFSECLTKGTFNEIEPFPNKIIIGRASVVDATEFTHSLPRSVK